MNAAQLGSTLSDSLKGTRLIVVANREPYIHIRRTRSARGLWNWLRGQKETVGIAWTRPASGLVTALDPVMRATGGTWIAHGSGNADRETADARGRVMVPPDRPSYSLRRVWLSPEEEQGYYYGCANNALWPLCHIAYARPEFDDADWQQYVRVNRRFADAVIEEVADDRAVVFVQDYHFALLPRFVKEARPDVTVCHFWHIPWPNREVFRVCPWGEDILHGLLGNDLLGFHVQYHCNNFLDTVDRALESRVDYEHFAAWRGGRPTFVRPFPISIDPSLWKGPTKAADRATEIRNVRQTLGLNGERIIFGVDRLDYTKGIPDRLKAFARLLDRYPEWRGRVTMVQVGAPSREHLQRYQALMSEVESCVTEINAKFRTDGWLPVVYRPQHHQPEAIGAMYRAADLCVVSSLHDGMNLVAKEFIASRSDELGVLLLSEFTGAARELEHAVHVNPFAVDSFADAMHAALLMPGDEQRRRMRALRARVGSHTVFDWANELLSAAVRAHGARALTRPEWAPLPLHHGAIGNGRVIALVGPDTSIDWLCLPRFDSPSVFARLLDQERGGRWAFEPVEEWRAKAGYVRNTNVMKTEIETGDGRFDLYDFAPRIMQGMRVDAPIEICRLLLPASGIPRVRVLFDPKPDYARANFEIAAAGQGVEVVGGPTRLYLSSNVAAPYLMDGSPIRIDRPIFFSLSAGRPPQVDSGPAAENALEQTIRGWRVWTKTCALPRFAQESVLRSALCLKLHAYNDTGAIIAAATTSIPEAIGSGRTWDYRFCWLRDAAFVVEALRRLGHLAEGEAFVRFLREMADSGPLQPMYSITGKRDLHEEIVTTLRGYDGAGPVRIGNAAYIQRQHDVNGEMVLCLETILTDPRVVWEDPALAVLLEHLVEEAMESFELVDTGLWEYRTQPRHHTFSKAMCWVAAHRGAELAEFLGMPELARQWGAWADEKRLIVLERAYNREKGYFAQSFEGEYPDASNLLLPAIGLIDPLDPRFRSTVRAYEKLLAPDGLMLRYAHLDDFGHTTSAFSICSFWWVEALAMMGEVDEAVALFRRLEKYANPLGLFSEDIEPSTGALLGNFPQAYTHVGLIHAAITIGEILDARHGSFRAWS